MSARNAAPGAAELRALARAARAARKQAYVPYSRFRVGAALRTTGGVVVTGCNIENASFPLTQCAERVAVGRARAEGHRRFDAIAVVADSPRVTAPCGGCRLVMWEMCGDIWVWRENVRGQGRLLRLSELLPLPFDGRNL